MKCEYEKKEREGCLQKPYNCVTKTSFFKNLLKIVWPRQVWENKRKRNRWETNRQKQVNLVSVFCNKD